MYLKLLKEGQTELISHMGKPFYVFASLSNICNANCIFCNVHDEAEKHSKVDFPRLLDELKLLGTRYIHFIGGGEPLAAPNIWEILSYASDLGMGICITSNGLALDDKKIKRLGEFNIKNIFFSLDSHIHQVHDGLRRVPGIWNKATENIKKIKNNMSSVSIIINHLLNKENIEYFEDMILLRGRVPFDFINPILIKDYSELYFNEHQIANYSKNVIKFHATASKAGVRFLYDDIDFFKQCNSGSPEYINGVYHQGNYCCYFSELSAYIDCPTARVFPCDCTVHRNSEAYMCGDLTRSSFSDIWNSDRMNNLRLRLKENSEDCKLNCDYVNFYYNKKMGELLKP